MSKALKPFWFLLLVLGAVAAFSVIRAGSDAKERIPWRTDFHAATVEAQTANKPLFLYFTATWCGPCQSSSRQRGPMRMWKRRQSAYLPVKIDIDEHRDFAELSQRRDSAFRDRQWRRENVARTNRRNGTGGFSELVECQGDVDRLRFSGSIKPNAKFLQHRHELSEAGDFHSHMRANIERTQDFRLDAAVDLHTSAAIFLVATKGVRFDTRCCAQQVNDPVFSNTHFSRSRCICRARSRFSLSGETISMIRSGGPSM